jgi:hypothetical protein
MLLLRNIQQRIGSAIAAIIAAIGFLLCGAIMAFVVSPQQAAEWRRIEKLPVLDAASYAAAETGSQVAVTGTLDGNAPLTEDGMVAYIRARWDVEPADPDVEDDQPDGTWNTAEVAAPALILAIDGGSISTLPADSPTFGGSQHEQIVPGESTLVADDNGQSLPDGTLRTRGFMDGDLVTVVGQKGSTGDVAPTRLFGGDRVQLVENIRSGARAAFSIGIGLMICSPFVLVGGILAGLFGRRR